MKTLYWTQFEVFELPYTKEFVGFLEMRSTEHGLRTDIFLNDSEKDDEIYIGTIISEEYDIEECHEYGCNMLMDEDYCMEIWRGKE